MEAKTTYDGNVVCPRTQEFFWQFMHPSLLGPERPKINPASIGT
jgi:hypothetical protein